MAACGGERSLVDATLGGPATRADSQQVVRMVATPTLRFIPGDVDVSVGDTVTFVVTNPGPIQHEFVLGDVDLQEEHEEILKSGRVREGTPYQIDLPPGSTRELTWTFTAPGDIQFGCHIGVPSHYVQGMLGHVTVAPSTG